MTEMRVAELRRVLDLAEQVAAELAAAAVDPAADLSAAERRALVHRALAVEAAAARRVEIEPRSAEAQAVLVLVHPESP